MKQGYKIHGFSVTRPAPTKPNSWRCSLGFHDMVPFVFDYPRPSFITGSWAHYCTRCTHMDEGVVVPDVRPMPPIKPPKSDPKFGPPKVKVVDSSKDKVRRRSSRDRTQHFMDESNVVSSGYSGSSSSSSDSSSSSSCSGGGD